MTHLLPRWLFYDQLTKENEVRFKIFYEMFWMTESGCLNYWLTFSSNHYAAHLSNGECFNSDQINELFIVPFSLNWKNSLCLNL